MRFMKENGCLVLHGSRGEPEADEDIREFHLGLFLTCHGKSFRDGRHYKRRKQ